MTATATLLGTEMGTEVGTENASIVRRALRGDATAFAPGYVCHAPPELFEADCPSAGTPMHRPHAAPFSGEQIRIDEITASGDRVVARFEGIVKHVGRYRGVAPSGRSRAAKVLAIYRLDGGRIAEGWGTLSWD